ncbi:MAG: hypothetical protein HYZ11_05925 [Candidatus Tectomicrobia bacterium]|uniref:Uncharacterized protein n=1 Tax=Tectimicrobiota bacterium TaxID=2528274 RepID=A0A932MPG3_UNCTE|nr:hypothetical protein [Candidatus Tectomicrobia bacterium]
MGWESVQAVLAGILSSPVFILLVSLGIFVALAWLALPFALYGVRRRLDRIIEGLDRLQALLEDVPGGPPAAPAGERAGGPVREGAGLLDELREALRGAVPELQERVLDAGRVEYVHRRGWGREFACLSVLLENGRLRASFPLRELEKAYPRFSGGQFEQYVRAFLGERHGVLPASPPGADELAVIIQPGTRKGLEIFAGIVREQLWGSMTEEASP